MQINQALPWVTERRGIDISGKKQYNPTNQNQNIDKQCKEGEFLVFVVPVLITVCNQKWIEQQEGKQKQSVRDKPEPKQKHPD